MQPRLGKIKCLTLPEGTVVFSLDFRVPRTNLSLTVRYKSAVCSAEDAGGVRGRTTVLSFVCRTSNASSNHCCLWFRRKMLSLPELGGGVFATHVFLCWYQKRPFRYTSLLLFLDGKTASMQNFRRSLRGLNVLFWSDGRVGHTKFVRHYRTSPHCREFFGSVHTSNRRGSVGIFKCIIEVITSGSRWFKKCVVSGMRTDFFMLCALLWYHKVNDYVKCVFTTRPFI